MSLWSNDLLLHSLIDTFFTLNSFSVVLQLRPDATALAVTFGFCLLATLLFSLGPAWQATHVDLVNDLKQQSGDPARAGRLGRFFAPRHLLVMAQLSLALMLLFSAGLFFQSARKLILNPGFDARDGIVAVMDFSLGRYDEASALRTMWACVRRAQHLPGVRGSALATLLPNDNEVDGRRVEPAATAPAARTDPGAPEPGTNGFATAITPGYFEAIGVPLLRGRDFTETEAENKNSAPVVIVDEKMARKLFPHGDALGQRIRYAQSSGASAPVEMEIVGIVRPIRYEGRMTPPRLFLPLAQSYRGAVYLHVRLTNANRAGMAAQIGGLREALRAVDPNLPLLQIAPFNDLVQTNLGLWLERLLAVMFGVFGGLALVLAVVGVYGVKAYAVARRTHEIGIRMALGAGRRDVFTLVMKQGALQTAFALGVGLLLALGIGRLLGRMLYEVSPMDPVALGISSLLLGAAALLACFLPARRAMRVSPMTALRTE